MKKRLRVLIVEDSASDSELLVAELTRGGYRPRCLRVETARAMLAALQGGSWDLVLADFRLPEFDAPSALAVVKHAGVDVPFIIVSGVIDEETAVASLRAGAHDFVLKTKLSRLLPAIARELREATVRRKRARAERALRESEMRYRLVTEHAGEAIFLLDPEGSVEYANPAVEHIFGYVSRDVVGKSLDALIPALPQLLVGPSTCEGGPSTVGGIPAVGVNRDGDPVELELSVGTFTHRGKRGRTIIARDVSLRKHAEARQASLYRYAERARAEAERARAQAEWANEAKSRWLAMLSHELRTPMTAVMGYAELLGEEIEAPLHHVQRAHVARIKACSQSLFKLIESLLSFAAIDAGRVHYTPTVVSLSEVIAASLTEVMPAAMARGVTCTVEPCDPTLRAHADVEKVRQILDNLLSNAIKYCAPNGRVTATAAAYGETVRVRVRDSGPGIPADKVDAIFEPFVQLDSGLTRRYGGVGLGLSISRDLATGMGGQVMLEETSAAGSVFALTLPRVQCDERGD
jgi:PAS domain S-box-containing protein